MVEFRYKYVLVLKNYNPTEKIHVSGELPGRRKPKKTSRLAIKIGQVFELIKPGKFSWWLRVKSSVSDSNIVGYIPSVFTVPLANTEDVLDFFEDVTEQQKFLPDFSLEMERFFPLIHQFYGAENIPAKSFPKDSANLFSNVFFFWMDKLMWTGYSRPLVNQDTWKLSKEYESNVNSKQFQDSIRNKVEEICEEKNIISETDSNNELLNMNALEANKKKHVKEKHKWFLRGTIFKMFKFKFIVAILLKLINDCLGYAVPFLLGEIISFAEGYKKNHLSVWYGFYMCFLMFVSKMVITIVLNKYFEILITLGLRVKSMMIATIYQKMTRLCPSSVNSYNSGDQVNLISVDCAKLGDTLTYINVMWSAPLQILIALIYLGVMLGVSTLAGMTVLIILMPITFIIGRKIKILTRKQLEMKDKRIKLLNEVLSGIKLVKLYAWEPWILESISKFREQELIYLRNLAYLNSIFALVWETSPLLISLVSFITYIQLGNTLDAKTAFVSLNIFAMLRFPLAILPEVINTYIQCNVSVKRLEKYLILKELDGSKKIDRDDQTENDLAINVKDVSLTWEKSEANFKLEINDLEIEKRKLVAIIGKIGSGKSSFISGMLGEMHKTAGEISLNGQVAYVPQVAWIQNMSLKNNILFEHKYDEEKYERVLSACCLQSDISLLPDGDMTEIGEKGVNLSGGQKQRVSVARAVYSNSDVYLFDDPLSAVDSHVAKKLFNDVFSNSGVLREKTRVVVTHKINFLPYFDQILLFEDGKIKFNGSYSEMIGSGVDLGAYISSEAEAVSNDNPLELADNGKIDAKSKKPAILIKQEAPKVGRILFKIYHKYFKSLSYTVILFMFLFLMVSFGCSLGSNLWTAQLSTYGIDKDNAVKYFGVYAGFIAGQIVFGFSANNIYAFGSFLASKAYHKKLLYSILRAPMLFFETTALGRIVNVFASDIFVLDVNIPRSFRTFISITLNMLFLFGGIVAVLPLFLIPLLILSVFYYFMQDIYVSSSRQIQRMNSALRSPIYSHYLETLQGVSVVRAYGKTRLFTDIFGSKVDREHEMAQANVFSNRWIAMRIETIGNFLVLFSALFSVVGVIQNTILAGYIGFAISSTSTTIQSLNWLIRTRGELETHIVAIERIQGLIKTPAEAPWESTDDTITEAMKNNWPKDGAISVEKFCTRYRPALPLSLRDLEFKINPGQKVGIVGRTGAGKSSIILSLFRIIEAAEGGIFIDDINISKVGLHDLRSRITVIPQESFLFNSSLRINVDPMGKFTDSEIWLALKQSHMKDYFESLPEGLDFKVNESGENISAGQRQLLCLARALLRKSKILVLDEATASVDNETDELIQKTIRTEFSDCTILTIAHRLNTILDYDMILVLSEGTVVEFDTPKNLLEDTKSVFYGMALESGIV